MRTNQGREDHLPTPCCWHCVVGRVCSGGAALEAKKRKESPIRPWADIPDMAFFGLSSNCCRRQVVELIVSQRSPGASLLLRKRLPPGLLSRALCPAATTNESTYNWSRSWRSWRSMQCLWWPWPLRRAVGELEAIREIQEHLGVCPAHRIIQSDPNRSSGGGHGRGERPKEPRKKGEREREREMAERMIRQRHVGSAGRKLHPVPRDR